MTPPGRGVADRRARRREPESPDELPLGAALALLATAVAGVVAAIVWGVT